MKVSLFTVVTCICGSFSVFFILIRNGDSKIIEQQIAVSSIILPFHYFTTGMSEDALYKWRETNV